MHAPVNPNHVCICTKEAIARYALKHTHDLFYGIRPLPSQIPFQRITTGLSENKASLCPQMC